MRDLLLYYYGIKADKLVYTYGKYIFSFNGVNYIFKQAPKDVVASYYDELNRELIKYKYFSKIVRNIRGSFITVFDGKNYVLLMVKNISSERVSIFDIRNDYYADSKYLIDNIGKFCWIEMWKRKVDVLEEWILNKKKQYCRLLPLFNYYIGVSEKAILYLKNVLKTEIMDDSDRLVFSHKRLSVDSRLYDYYDSSLLIIDHHSRDIAEYIKDMFCKDALDYDAIAKYINSNYFSTFGRKALYARLLFPSFFFDNIDGITLDDSTFKQFEKLTLNLDSFLDKMKNILKV